MECSRTGLMWGSTKDGLGQGGFGWDGLGCLSGAANVESGVDGFSQYG